MLKGSWCSLAVQIPAFAIGRALLSTRTFFVARRSRESMQPGAFRALLGQKGHAGREASVVSRLKFG